MYNLTGANFAECEVQAYMELEKCQIPVCQTKLSANESAAAICGAMASKCSLCGYFQLDDGQAALLIRRVRDWHILFLKPVIGVLNDSGLRTVRKGRGVIACYADTEEQLELVAAFLHADEPSDRISKALRQDDVSALLARLSARTMRLEPLLPPNESGPQS